MSKTIRLSHTARPRRASRSNTVNAANLFPAPAQEDMEEHSRSFHDFIDLPAVSAFRLDSAEFPPQPSVFPLAK